jgi:hypothetical protein
MIHGTVITFFKTTITFPKKPWRRRQLPTLQRWVVYTPVQKNFQALFCIFSICPPDPSARTNLAAGALLIFGDSRLTAEL